MKDRGDRLSESALYFAESKRGFGVMGVGGGTAASGGKPKEVKDQLDAEVQSSTESFYSPCSAFKSFPP